MAGHSKWANIRYRKGTQDARRGKMFTKLIREITVAARTGGPDEHTNPRLREVVSKSLKANMKRDTIEHAIKRGVGDVDGAQMVEMRYEGYGPGGVAVLVDCLSDNKNRTVSEVRHAFTKCGGNLGTDGSVAYLFEARGEILLAPTDRQDEAFELAIELGANDVNIDEGQVEVITPIEAYHAISAALEKGGFVIEESRKTMHPMTTVTLETETGDSLVKLLDMLEDLDDVQEVHCNAAQLEAFYG
jgi:YebC/PmpR family DNA-binding regulatory protein